MLLTAVALAGITSALTGGTANRSRDFRFGGD